MLLSLGGWERALKLRVLISHSFALLAVLLMSHATLGATISYSYDANGRPQSVTYDNGTVITYQLDNNGNRLSASVVSSTPPGAPSGSVTFTSITQNSATANWGAATAGSASIAGYDYQVNGGSWVSLGVVYSALLTGLTTSTNYTVAVRARDSYGNSGSSISGSFNTTSGDSTPPSAPGAPGFSGLMANSVTASWGAATDNVGVVAYDYEVNGGAWTTVGTSLSVSLTGLASGVGYTVGVRARDAAGNIGPISSASFSTPDNIAPGPPGSVSVSSIAGTTAIASWGAASDNIAVSGYEYTLNGGSSWVGVGNVLSVNLTGLSSYTSYTISVRAYDAAGNRGAASSTNFGTLDSAAPSAPGTPTISSLTYSSATASWSAATDNAGVTGYEYSLNSGGSWQGVGTNQSVNLAGLSASTGYTIYVRAFDAAGNRGANASASFTTSAPPPTVITIGSSSAPPYSYYGYGVGSIGSISNGALSGGVTITTVEDVYYAGSPPYVAAFTVGSVSVSGFTANPGQSWLTSVTVGAYTLNGSAATFTYSGNTASWFWMRSTLGLYQQTGTRTVTITH